LSPRWSTRWLHFTSIVSSYRASASWALTMC